MVPQGSHTAAIKTIVLHILLCLLIFYTVYYMIGSICCGAFRLNNFGMLIPFEFNMEPSYSNPNYLANVLSMETTFLISGLLFAVLLKRWVWDYTITVTMAHVLLTVAETENAEEEEADRQCHPQD
ncbi:putative transmembrane protein 244 [Zootoca vivipara]|uniref:putative transmembrane protein 244 n=1 Tax=Zootoca vivipara TaxID=8524 RepID=UPI0015927CA7|nr:putative transmembrane protein 244 [Zootoca vivipara]